MMILNILLKRFEMYVNIHAVDGNDGCAFLFNVLFDRGFESFSKLTRGIYWNFLVEGS